MIPSSSGLPAELRRSVAELGRQWAASPDRPRADMSILAHWTRLVTAWAADPLTPLLIRKFNAAEFGRGSHHHHRTGRALVPVDNSPANWCLASAILGRQPDIASTLGALEAGALPIAMMFTKAEREAAHFRGTLSGLDDPPDLNALGWKVGHVREVGLRSRVAITDLPIETLQEHHRLLLDPANMFVVPKSHAGLAELPEFIEAFAR